PRAVPPAARGPGVPTWSALPCPPRPAAARHLAAGNSAPPRSTPGPPRTYSLVPFEKGKETMRRLFVPLTALGLLGIVIGCRGKGEPCGDNYAPCCGPNGGAPHVVTGQPVPAPANGKQVPDMPPPKDGNPEGAKDKDKDKDKDNEPTVGPLKSAP